MKYLKEFETTADYAAYSADTENFILPNISVCNDDIYKVYYNPIPLPETKLVVYYDIQDISSPTTVHTNFSNSFKSMEIDGADSVDLAQGYIQYQFSSVGEHIIKYEPVDSTVGSNSPLFYTIAIPMRVIIPNTFTQIGVNAFLSCFGLTSCTIGSGVTSIGSTSFTQCSGLTSIVIPDSVTSIGGNAFENCTSLTSCTIGNGVTSIGGNAFKACYVLTSVTVNATTPPTLGYSAFDNTNSCPIYVPSASVETYKSASSWSSYASRIQAIPQNI